MTRLCYWRRQFAPCLDSAAVGAEREKPPLAKPTPTLGAFWPLLHLVPTPMLDADTHFSFCLCRWCASRSRIKATVVSRHVSSLRALKSILGNTWTTVECQLRFLAVSSHRRAPPLLGWSSTLFADLDRPCSVLTTNSAPICLKLSYRLRLAASRLIRLRLAAPICLKLSYRLRLAASRLIRFPAKL